MDLRSALITQKYTQVEHERNYRYNAPHHFKVKRVEDDEVLCEIDFQEGPINEVGVNGVCNEDLVAMVIRRLEGFQDSPYKCRENALAITKLEEALMWLRKRTLEREIRRVEGTSVV